MCVCVCVCVCVWLGAGGVADSIVRTHVRNTISHTIQTLCHSTAADPRTTSVTNNVGVVTDGATP